jgi:YD repeat-containing protein
MKVHYDPEVDVLRIVFAESPVHESDEARPGVILDYDAQGNIVGIEVLDASRQIANPRTMEYGVAAG